MSIKEIVVISGKGGTGKTSIVGSFASLISKAVLADCDVDAADLHLLLEPIIKEEKPFYGGKVAFIDEIKCNECGLCEEMCRFEAIESFKVEPVFCEGCCFCYYLCPEEAVQMKDDFSGHWFLSETRYGPLVHARLGVAAENSGKLVAEVRQKAREVAREKEASYILTDGPPGTGCPVIASITGADLALVVTEPSISGLHDLERIADVTKHFNIPSLVCINKHDLHPGKSREIENYCEKENIKVAGRVRFDSRVIEALIEGKSLVEYSKGKAAQEVKGLWLEVLNNINEREG